MLKIRAVGLIVVNGKGLCSHTDQGMAARQRAKIEGTPRGGYRGSIPHQPRDQSLLYTAATKDFLFFFPSQYAVNKQTDKSST